MSTWTKEKMDEVYGLVMEKARVDEAFRKNLIADPNKTIEELAGIPVPADYKIRVIEHDPAYQATFFLPEMLGEEITVEDMDTVAGGSCAAEACAGQMCAGQVGK